MASFKTKKIMRIKNLLLTIITLGAFSTSLFANHNHSDLKINTTISQVKWTGKKVTGEHNGSIAIKEGTLNLHDGKFSGGTVVMDMTSITCEDLKDKTYNKKLVDHLNSPDFFDVANHPTATLKIIRAVAVAGKTHIISGALTIKGITMSIDFPAEIEIKEGKLVASAELKIDRTLYDIKYGSGKFFEDLGDKMIDDKFIINLKIAAQ